MATATRTVHSFSKRTAQQRVQSGPLRHAKGAKKERYSPVMSRAKPFSTKSSESCLSSSSAEGLLYREVKGDLFSCSASSSLGHCVSEDLRMGKGIAVAFKKNFGGLTELKEQGAKTGGLAVLKRNERFIYYLVTKPKYFHKPTYETLRSSLLAMKAHCSEYKVKELSLPRIGSGLDRLEWGKVSGMIQEVFHDMDIAVTIYYL